MLLLTKIVQKLRRYPPNCGKGYQGEPQPGKLLSKAEIVRDGIGLHHEPSR
jgi:hypothetical protein